MYLLKFLSNKFRWNKLKLSPPLIIFESDDWGTIRMPSKFVKDKLTGINPKWVDDPYLQFDSLETDDDVCLLFNLLSKYKGADGRPPVITANCILQNPDFNAIRFNGFSQYIGQDFRASLQQNPKSNRVFSLQKQALSEGYFFPQFHGREHIHILRWLTSLQENSPLAQVAFENGMISLKSGVSFPCVNFKMDAFNPINSSNLFQIIEIAKDGLSKFEAVWGYNARTLIAPCYFWHSDMELELSRLGILGFQGLAVQKQSTLNGNPFKIRKIYHYQWEKNNSNQFYMIRNAFFEPSLNPSIDWVSCCMKEIDKGIKNYGFATISCHRLNFMGSINPSNRDKNLFSFELLLKQIILRYPNVRFGTTVDLLNAFLEAKD